MSSYTTKTKHPRTGEWENADWIDDFYGRHRYGIKFADGKVFKEDEIKEFEYGVMMSEEKPKESWWRRIINKLK